MGFLVVSAEGEQFLEGMMRRLVEVVDAYRGKPQVFVVFRNSFPYQAVSVHATEQDARTAAAAASDLRHFGPVTPTAAPSSFKVIKKTVGTTFTPIQQPVATVVLLDAEGKEVERYTLTPEGRLP